MLDLNLPIQTRDGRKVIYLGKAFLLGEYDDGVFMASYEETPGNWTVRDYFKSGRGDSEKEIPIDVINVPVKHKLTGFLVVNEEKIIMHETGKIPFEPNMLGSPVIAVIDLSKLDYEFDEGEGL